MQTQAHLTNPGAQAGAHLGLRTGLGGLDPRDAQAWQPRVKKHVADLLDDADALADWHRNLERLRQPERA